MGLVFLINCATPQAINMMVLLVLKEDKVKDSSRMQMLQWMMGH